MPINIDIEFYNGPFDLLLNLIEKNKIDIYDVKLSDITEEYLREVESLKAEKPENIVEFIYLASTLLEIKSKKLLPKNEYLDEEDEIVTEEMILERLIEYRHFKELSEKLKEMKKIADRSISKYQEDLMEYSTDIVENSIIGDTNILLSELLDILKRNQVREENLKEFELIRAEEYSVEKYMEDIQWTLEGKKRMNLKNFIKDVSSKQEIIVVFLSVLELIKTKVVRVFQDETFSEIVVELR